jgi:uncharacterized lipoprotein YmbA
MRRTFRNLASIAALGLAGCASTPVTLIALPPPAAVERPDDVASGPTILLRDVTLPGYLDSFPVVLGRADGALVVSKNAEWAERLPQGVARVLRDALSRRLGAERTLIAGDGRIPDAVLTIEFLSLDPLGDSLNLDTRWFFSCAVRAQSSGGRSHLQVPLAGSTPESVARATTAALTRFADEIAATVPCARSPAHRAAATAQSVNVTCLSGVAAICR